MKLKLFNFNSEKIKKRAYFLASLSAYFIIDKYLIEEKNDENENIKKQTIKNSLDYNHLNQIFLKKDVILNNEMKKYTNLSTPFNRKIKYIYDLPFEYPEYENYNFNKLSDFFLNIHIFIN